MKVLISLILMSVFSMQAISAMDKNKMISRLGVQGGNIYFDYEGMSLTCKNGPIYFKSSTDFGRSAYSMLLAAKSSKAMVSRIDYTQNEESKICTLTLVEVN
jgi:hypothetical protein